MDVHPPLAKLLITLAGWSAGFDGEFDFKDIGKDYLEPGVPYVAMRLLPALLGVLTIPAAFLTLKVKGCTTLTAAMGAALVTFGKYICLFFANALLTGCCRKRPFDPIAPHFARLTIGCLYRLDRSLLRLLHQPA